MEEPLPVEVQKQPWKYVGYRRYTEFISSDSDLLIFRRFGALNARVGLLLQDKISLLEQKLFDLDKEYNKFLIQQSQLREYIRAPSRDVKSLRTWHNNHQNVAIDEEEHRYLEEDQDLIRLRSRDKTPLRNWIDNSLALRTLSIWKKQSRAIPEYDANNVSYYSNTGMDAFASAVIVLIGASILITPIWILQAIENLQMKLAVITAFVLVFLLLLSFVMVSKPFEALGATAAYAAVLMVFIQVGS
ncbi:hypothetical protein GGR55DRAFT_678214 [Xylaria sp. FL0064]|nr:hypothetical protein GGR55DRAFT_678214 [Xylaria sp. FL0064]